MVEGGARRSYQSLDDAKQRLTWSESVLRLNSKAGA